MERVRLESGFVTERMTKQEQDKVWRELSEDVSPVGKGVSLFTPRDNLEYQILSETETSFERYKVILLVQGKKITVNTTLTKQDAQINKAVRKAYLAVSK